MYLSYYNLKRKPFQISTDPRFLWLGEKHKEALAILRYGIQDNKGFLLLTGDVGTGKTTLINALLNSLDEQVLVATVPDPALDKLDFYKYIANSFNIDEPFQTKVEFLLLFRNFLQKSISAGRRVLLIVDEAQRLSHEVLEEIRLLSNIERQSSKLLNIFFVGQNEFNEVLSEVRNRAIRQRITVNFHIDALTEEEVGSYIAHRLQVSGCRKVVFSPDAIHQVYLFSGGYPRLVNVICDRALLSGYVEEAKLIKGRIVRECAKELELPKLAKKKEKIRGEELVAQKGTQGKMTEKSPPGTWRRLRLTPAFLALPVLAVLGGTYYSGQEVPVSVERFIDRLLDQPSQESLATVAPPDESEAGSLPEPAASGMPRARAPGEGDDLRSEAAASRATGASGRAAEAGGLSPKEPLVAGVEKRGPVSEFEPLASSASEPVPPQTPPVSSPPEIQEEVLTPLSPAGQPEEKPQPPEVGPIATLMPREEISAGEREEAAASLPEVMEKEVRPWDFTINFEVDSNELSQQDFRELEQLAAYLKQNPGLGVIVVGYTDTSGFYNYNLKISESRANMVKGFLVGRGIDSAKIQTFGKGPANPMASNETAEGRQANRRVEFELFKYR